MAVYFTLAIDCGRSREAAEHVALHFRDLQIELPGVSRVACHVSVEEKRHSWIVGVWPSGLGYACISGRADYNTTPEMVPIAGQQLYNHLSKLSNYRAALFGFEASDFLELSETPAEEELALVGMVFSESLAKPDSILSKQPVFSRGYRWNPE